MRVFLTHNPEDRVAYFGRALPRLEACADVTVNPLDRDLTTTELIEAAARCQVIIAHRSTAGPAEVFDSLPDLQAFLRTAVDVSTIDIAAASRNGVLVANADKSFVDSTAELALGLALDVLRSISISTSDYHRGEQPPQRPGRQLRGKTAGVIGFGAIGSRLAEMLSALGVEVVVHDSAVRADGFEQTSLDALLKRADIVFPLVPGTEENLIGDAELAQMKPGAILVNVSRGEVIDDDAVERALDSGTLAGLGIDVGRDPDQRPTTRLATRHDVVATPHLGGLTPENADAQALSAVEQVEALVAGEVPPRSLNAEHAHRVIGR